MLGDSRQHEIHSKTRLEVLGGACEDNAAVHGDYVSKFYAEQTFSGLQPGILRLVCLFGFGTHCNSCERIGNSMLCFVH